MQEEESQAQHNNYMMMTAYWSGICSTANLNSIAAEIDALLTLPRLRIQA
jgi:hypothetical protein